MTSRIPHRLVALCTVALAFAMTLTLCACSGQTQVNAVRIGTMPTEDILPMWVAEEEGYFEEAGIDAEIIVFDSAQSLSAAITAGEVDMAMTDPMRAVKLVESGTELSMEWVTLGLSPDQGRFGVITSADSGLHTLADLAGGTKGVGLAANTVPEYVFEKLCEQAGIDPASILTQEVASLPDRYGLVASGQLDAAALPASMLEFGQANGLVLIADDSAGANISQSVMVARSAFAQDDGAQIIQKLREVWDKAANAINANPEGYRVVLIENANLNEQVAEVYPICTYPLALDANGQPAYPPATLIDPVIEWMKAKGYVEGDVSYDAANGSITVS